MGRNVTAFLEAHQSSADPWQCFGVFHLGRNHYVEVGDWSLDTGYCSCETQEALTEDNKGTARWSSYSEVRQAITESCINKEEEYMDFWQWEVIFSAMSELENSRAWIVRLVIVIDQ